MINVLLSGIEQVDMFQRESLVSKRNQALANLRLLDLRSRYLDVLKKAKIRWARELEREKERQKEQEMLRMRVKRHGVIRKQDNLLRSQQLISNRNFSYFKCLPAIIK